MGLTEREPAFLHPFRFSLAAEAAQHSFRSSFPQYTARITRTAEPPAVMSRKEKYIVSVSVTNLVCLGGEDGKRME
jgi:hypothetical protein